MNLQALEHAEQLAELLHPLGELAVYGAGAGEPLHVYNQLSRDPYSIEDAPSGSFMRALEGGRQAKATLLSYADGSRLLISVDISPIQQLSSFLICAEE